MPSGRLATGASPIFVDAGGAIRRSAASFHHQPYSVIRSAVSPPAPHPPAAQPTTSSIVRATAGNWRTMR